MGRRGGVRRRRRAAAAGRRTARAAARGRPCRKAASCAPGYARIGGRARPRRPSGPEPAAADPAAGPAHHLGTRGCAPDHSASWAWAVTMQPMMPISAVWTLLRSSQASPASFRQATKISSIIGRLRDLRVGDGGVDMASSRVSLFPRRDVRREELAPGERHPSRNAPETPPNSAETDGRTPPHRRRGGRSDRGPRARAGRRRETVLRPQSAAVLRALAARRGETVSKDALHAAVWGDIAVTDDSLVQCIGDIRRALGAARDARADRARSAATGWPPRGRRARAPRGSCALAAGPPSSALAAALGWRASARPATPASGSPARRWRCCRSRTCPSPAAGTASPAASPRR